MRNSRLHNFLLILIWGFIGSIAAYFLYMAIQNGGISFEPKYQGEPTIILNDITLDSHVDTVSIDWITGGVKIIPTTGDKVRIVEKTYKEIDESKEVKVTLTGTSLELKTRNKTVFSFFGLNAPATFLEVYLPIKNSFEKIKINGVSGTYKIDDVYSNLIQITLTSGDLSLDQSFSSLLSLKLTSGNATISDSEFLATTIEITSGQLNYAAKSTSFTVKMTSGLAQLDFLDELPTQLDLSMTSGLMDVTLHGSNPFSFTVKKTSGSFNPHYEVMKNGNSYAYKNGGPNYSLKLTSGKVDVNLLTN